MAALPILCLGALAAVSAASFSVTDDAFGDVKLKVLQNSQTGERVEVAYTAGGRTEALVLRSPLTGQLREVLLHNNRNASDVLANTGFKGDLLIPYANRIKNGTYQLNGKTYYLERNEDRSPWGREGIHGYLYKKVMQVLAATADNERALLTLAYDFDGSDPGYPFPLTVEIIYKLDAAGFSITTKARNREVEGGVLPFFHSWHSYFLVSDISRAIVTLDRCSGWNHIRVSGDSNENGDLIPTGATEVFSGFDGSRTIGGTTDSPTYWDDEFKATASALQCPTLQYRVHDTITGETSVLWADSEIRWVQVFTGTKKKYGQHAIAVEAMSGEADAWNNMQGLRLLQGGEEFAATFGVYLDRERGTEAELHV